MCPASPPTAQHQTHCLNSPAVFNVPCGTPALCPSLSADLTKKFDGQAAALGGYPTPIDVGYPFEYPAPFFGQPGAGTPFHCPLDAPWDVQVGKCPAVETVSDDGPEGPCYIPPHIAVHALMRAHVGCEMATIDRWFTHGCRVPAAELLAVIRRDFPRPWFAKHSDYPPSSAKGIYNMSVATLEFPSPSGSPHWCEPAYLAANKWADYCPYHSNGRYVHGHLIFAALQQWLAHQHNPTLCGTKWDDSNYPMQPDSSIAFPNMVNDGNLTRPALPYVWPGPEGRKRKALPLEFVTRLVLGQRPGRVQRARAVAPDGKTGPHGEHAGHRRSNLHSLLPEPM